MIAVLGPEYSYCHIAAMRSFKGASFVLCRTINDVFSSVADGKADEGVVPIENMLQGSVRETIFALAKNNVFIHGAYKLPIAHCLASKSESFSKIVSHPQALGQCSVFLKAIGKDVVETSSTSEAMKIAGSDVSYAAIGSELAAKMYWLKILRKNIGDSKNNTTLFIRFSKKKHAGSAKNCITSMLIIPKKDMPGLLVSLLTPFASAKLNLSKIESVPSGKKLGEYFFIIDIDAGLKEVSRALKPVSRLASVRILGSYGVKNLD
ncbi:prephenate dehydratase [Candidatus Woesearchaeota archaeon]|nr:prephenate dehydratase [Candidatus Woesearchaeota archaeon]